MGGMIGLQEGSAVPRRGKKKPAGRVLGLVLTLAGCQPPVWRRVVVKESASLAHLHDVIQVAFDWFDYQTHLFTVGDRRYGNPVKREEHPVEDDRDLTLADVDLAGAGVIGYDYQMGEGWRVEVRVETVGKLMKGAVAPACLAGERAGPPEDCGGVEAYHDMVACLKEPDSDLGKEWREWVGPDYDAEKCDIEAINTHLKRVKR